MNIGNILPGSGSFIPLKTCGSPVMQSNMQKIHSFKGHMAECQPSLQITFNRLRDENFSFFLNQKQMCSCLKIFF